MATTEQWKEDHEAFSIAMKLADHYVEMFSHIELNKVLFIRIIGKGGSKIAKMIPNKFPYDINSPYVYFSQIYHKKWSMLTNEQRNVVIFQQLMGIPEGGFDSSSKLYGKIRKKDVEDYSEVLSAVAGNFKWNDFGASVVNILDGYSGNAGNDLAMDTPLHNIRHGEGIEDNDEAEEETLPVTEEVDESVAEGTVEPDENDLAFMDDDEDEAKVQVF